MTTRTACKAWPGVISIKDVFRRFSELMKEHPIATEDAGVSKVIAVAALDEKRRKGLRALLGQGGRMPVIELGEGAPEKVGELEDRHTVGIVALDLDGYAPEQWLPCLQAARARPAGPPFLYVYSQGAHDPRNVALVKDLAKTNDRFGAIARPLPPLEVLHHVRIWLGSRSRLA